MMRALRRWVPRAGAFLVALSSACIQEYSLADLAETGLEACDEGLTVCEGDCVNTQSDLDNCGTCGLACDDNEVCEAGFCVSACVPACEVGTQWCVENTCECRPGLELCGDGCVDTESDWNHCGGCNAPCDPGDVCLGGECQPNCGLLGNCNGDCVDFGSHPLNCGDCGVRCEGSSICIEGFCIEAAEADANACDGCPCPQACDLPGFPACCFDDFLDGVVCVPEGEC